MNLLPLLREIFSNGSFLSSLQQRELINYALQTALQFLNYKYHSDRAKFTNLGYSFTDIAIDAIAPLFTNNKTNETGIIKSLKDWKKTIDTEAAAHYFLNKVVVNRVEQELIKIYKEADPFFAKIHDSISFVIEKSGYCKQTHFGTVYLQPSIFESCKKLIPIEEFENLPAGLFVGKLNKVIENLFTYLSGEGDYRQAIPLNWLIKRIKQVNCSDADLGNSYIIDNNEESIDIQAIVSNSLNVTFNKLSGSYGHKLSEPEIEAFKKALMQISIDLANGGISSELYYYLHSQIPGISKDHFYDKYHSILDYLLRTLKKEIAWRLENN